MNRSHVRLLMGLSVTLALVAVISCGKKNRAADIPTVPSGRDSCFADTVYTYKTIAVDPDSDDVSVRIDWGNGDTSDWSVTASSGDTVTFSHAWPQIGSYNVRAQARDLQQQSSDWSGALVVNVFVARPAPDAPSEPDGPARGVENTDYTFSTVAFHPENLTVAIRFVWRDGDTSDWSAFVAPGESISMTHRWPTPDTYAVMAQAKDTGNATSQWSAPHNIRIWPPDTLQLWRTKLTAMEGSSFYSSPAFGPDGNIYVGSPDSALYSINPADGSVRWRYLTGDLIRSSPAIAPDGTIYIGSYDNVLHAVSPSGSSRWTFTTNDFIHASPAIGANGTVYIPSMDHWFYALNPDGSQQWRSLASKAGRSSPAVAASDTIYVGSDEHTICSVGPNGTLRWEYQTGGAIHSSPSFAADGTIYCGSDDGYLYALNPDKTLKWKFAAGGGVQGSAAIGTDGTVYFGADDSTVYALDPNGSEKWRFPVGGGVVGSPAIAADGTIYVGSSDYSVYALNPGGSAKWQFETDGAVKSSPTIGADGKVYFTSSDGHLYALKGTSPLAGSPWPKFHHDLRNTGHAGASR